MATCSRFSDGLVIDANGVVAAENAGEPPAAEQVQRARRFLEHFARRAAAINTRCSSYGLKHTAEKLEGYISNGAFIQAAHELGYRMKLVRAGSLNVRLNISVSKGVEHYLCNPDDYRPGAGTRTRSGHARRRFASRAEEERFIDWLGSRRTR